MITKYFFKRQLNKWINKILDFHIDRIKKKWLKRAKIFIVNNIVKEDVNAFMMKMKDLKNKKHKAVPIIVIQVSNLRKTTNKFILQFLNDNIIELLRHEFSHLKYDDEKKTEKLEKKIDLFKETKKRK